MDTEREMANVEFLSCPYLVLSALSGHMARYHQRVDQSSGARDDVTVAGHQHRVLLLLGHSANTHNCVDIFRTRIWWQFRIGCIFSIAIGWGTKVSLQIFLHREEEALIIYQFSSLESCGVQHH